MIYCGPACRKEANDAYHKYECGITDVIHKAQIGGWALAYRAITTHPFEYFLENKDKILNSNELLGSKDHNDEVSASYFELRHFYFNCAFRILLISNYFIPGDF